MIYRATALAALQNRVDADDEAGLARLAASLDLRFEGMQIRLGGIDVAEALRGEAVGNLASRISAWPQVRQALLGLQLSYRRVPGLVADGREAVGMSIKVNSGYRGPALNKRLKGATKSQHLEGQAADIEAPGLAVLALFKKAIELRLPFDQIIYEVKGPS